MTTQELVHQLNNELTIVQGCLTLLVTESDLPPAARELAALALLAGERAAEQLQGYQCAHLPRAAKGRGALVVPRPTHTPHRRPGA